MVRRVLADRKRLPAVNGHAIGVIRVTKSARVYLLSVTSL